MTAAGCGGGGSPARAAAPAKSYYVDVTNGQLITAYTAGREPVLINDRSRIPDPPRIYNRETLAPERVAGSDEHASVDADDGKAPLVAGGSRPSIASQPLLTTTTAPAPDLNLANFEGLSDDGEARTVWSILLRSIPNREAQHQQMAAAAASAMQASAPDLRGNVWVHSTESGSMILYGQFPSLEDAHAQSELKWVKQVEVQGRTPYSMAHFAKIDLGGGGPRQYHEFDLRSLRQKHRAVDPLYTMSVAVWITPGEEREHLAGNKRAAEAYAAQLRAQGYEAYFYHNESLMLSDVTVGKFDRSHIDSESGLFSADIRRVFTQFPKRLNNGEEMIDPNTGKIQIPQLVQLPKTLD